MTGFFAKVPDLSGARVRHLRIAIEKLCIPNGPYAFAVGKEYYGILPHSQEPSTFLHNFAQKDCVGNDVLADGTLAHPYQVYLQFRGELDVSYLQWLGGTIVKVNEYVIFTIH